MIKRKTRPARDRLAGIAQLMEIELGGLKQWVLLRGADRRKPILLYLHGGPGVSLIGVSAEFFKRLEQHFIVVNWDQRGSGLSAAGGDNLPDGLGIEQYVADALELTRHLLKRFRRDKIFLVGHSWGSAIGILAARRHPEYYYAFVGCGQVADMLENEKLEYEQLMQLACAQKNMLLMAQLKRMGPPPYNDVGASMALRSDFTRKYNERRPSERRFRREFARAMLRSSEYRLTDVLRYMRAHARSVKLLWEKLLNVNLFELVPGLELPCFFILGRMDVIVLPEISVRFIEGLSAPHKELIWMETGHSMQYEASGAFQTILIKKLTPLAPPTG